MGRRSVSSAVTPSPPRAFSLSPLGGLSLSSPTPLSPPYLPHPSICGLLHCHGTAATPFPRRTGTPLTRRVPSALECSGPPFPTALCSGGHAPGPARAAIGRPGHVRRAAPLPRGNCSPRRGGTAWVRRRCALSNLRTELVVQKTASGVAQLHRVGVPTWADASQVFPRLGLPGKPLLSGSFCGSSHILKTALREASGVDGPRPPAALLAPRGDRVVSFGLGFRTLNPGLVGTSRYRILRVRSSQCWSGIYRCGF